MTRLVGVLLLLAMTALSLAVSAAPAVGAGAAADTVVRETALDQHVRRLAKQMRCLVCQGESVAASQSDFAKDVRDKIRELLQGGRSDKQVFDYFVARYGDFILYKPPFELSTWALWFGPLLMLIIGLVGLFGYLRARARAAAPVALSPEQSRRARELLGDVEEPHR